MRHCRRLPLSRWSSIPHITSCSSRPALRRTACSSPTKSGVVTNTIALNGARGLALDGTTLYVGESGASDIAVIDTSTLTVTRRLATGANTCPTSVAVVASRYVTYGLECDRQWGSVNVIDLTSVAHASRGFGREPLLQPDRASSPEQHDRDCRGTWPCPSGVSIVNVSGSPTVTKSVWELANGCGTLRTSLSVLMARTSFPRVVRRTTTMCSALPTYLRRIAIRQARTRMLRPSHLTATPSPVGRALATPRRSTSCRQPRAITLFGSQRGFRHSLGD